MNKRQRTETTLRVIVATTMFGCGWFLTTPPQSAYADPPATSDSDRDRREDGRKEQDKVRRDRDKREADKRDAERERERCKQRAERYGRNRNTDWKQDRRPESDNRNDSWRNADRDRDATPNYRD